MLKSLRGIDSGVWFGFLWFLCIIDGFYTWFFPTSIVLVIGTLFSLLSFILLSKKGGVNFKCHRNFQIGITLVFLLYLCLFKGLLINAIITYVPLLMFIVWRDEKLIDFYKLLRAFLLFFAIGGFFAGILNFTGLLDLLPHFIFEARDNVQDLHGTFSKVYGFFVFSSDGFETSTRVCGCFREGGHFAIFLGLMYFIELTSFRKRNLWFLLCGLMTFSSNIIICITFAELFVLLEEGHLGKTIRNLFLFFVLIIVVFMCLPDSLQELLLYQAFGRNLQDVLLSIWNGDLTEALDLRANSDGESYYYSFIAFADFSTFLFGAESSTVFEDAILSDYRYIILIRGLIGLILTFLLIIAYAYNKNKIIMTFLILIAIVILLHRAWMFTRVYVYVLMLLATISYKLNHLNKIGYGNQKIY